MPEGVIVKALSGYYYVSPSGFDGEPVQCRARGIFKKKGVSPLVGDRVFYETTENGEGTVTEILPRSTELIRPPVANIDQALLVFSLAEPALNLQLLDKFLVHTQRAGLETLICLSKQDLLAEGDQTAVASYEEWDAKAAEEGSGRGKTSRTLTVEQVRNLYERIGYPVLTVSARTMLGIGELRERLRGKMTVFSGQSGVGKSSLLNALVPGLSLQTDEISQKLGRGKHTTRHVELIPLGDGGFVADTPGFSQLDFLQMEPEDLSSCFPDFARYASGCKFRGCLHKNEPGCQVAEALAEGQIAASRYKHYLLFLQEMKERKRRY